MPLLSCITFGAPIRVEEGEVKADFWCGRAKRCSIFNTHEPLRRSRTSLADGGVLALLVLATVIGLSMKRQRRQ